ncbi:hypothetical protein D3C80_2113730 [compost metagenome]
MDDTVHSEDFLPYELAQSFNLRKRVIFFLLEADTLESVFPETRSNTEWVKNLKHELRSKLVIIYYPQEY